MAALNVATALAPAPTRLAAGGWTPAPPVPSVAWAIAATLAPLNTATSTTTTIVTTGQIWPRG